MRDRSPTPSSAVDDGPVRIESSAPSRSPVTTGPHVPSEDERSTEPLTVSTCTVPAGAGVSTPARAADGSGT